jgi:hypothetical protein
MSRNVEKVHFLAFYVEKPAVPGGTIYIEFRHSSYTFRQVSTSKTMKFEQKINVVMTNYIRLK